jgi:hypothetical protein
MTDVRPAAQFASVVAYRRALRMARWPLPVRRALLPASTDVAAEA